MVNHPNDTCPVVVVWGSWPLKNRVKGDYKLCRESDGSQCVTIELQGAPKWYVELINWTVSVITMITIIIIIIMGILLNMSRTVYSDIATLIMIVMSKKCPETWMCPKKLLWLASATVTSVLVYSNIHHIYINMLNITIIQLFITLPGHYKPLPPPEYRPTNH